MGDINKEELVFLPEDSKLIIEGKDIAVLPGEKVYQQRVFFKPVETHYEDVGEKPYIKYSCPICRAVMKTSIYLPLTKFQIPPHYESCPVCGVNLYWED